MSIPLCALCRFPYHEFSAGFSFANPGGGHRIYVCVTSDESDRITACEEKAVDPGEESTPTGVQLEHPDSVSDERGGSNRDEIGALHVMEKVKEAAAAHLDAGTSSSDVLAALLDDLDWLDSGNKVRCLLCKPDASLFNYRIYLS